MIEPMLVPGDVVDRNVELLERADDADVRDAARSAAAEREADPRAARAGRSAAAPKRRGSETDRHENAARQGCPSLARSACEELIGAARCGRALATAVRRQWKPMTESAAALLRAPGRRGRPASRHGPARTAGPVLLGALALVRRLRYTRLVADLDAAGGTRDRSDSDLAFLPIGFRPFSSLCALRALARLDAADAPGLALPRGGVRLLLAGRRALVRLVVDLAGRLGTNGPVYVAGQIAYVAYLPAAPDRPALLPALPADAGRGAAVLARRRTVFLGGLMLLWSVLSPRSRPCDRRAPRTSR